MEKLCLVFKVLLLIYVTSAEFNLNSWNTTSKSLDTFNQSKITLNKTWDYKDDDPIMRHTDLPSSHKLMSKEIGKFLLNTTTITTKSHLKYLLNQKLLKADNFVQQLPEEEATNKKNHYQNSNHFYHYLTTIKFNKRNNENNYDNYKSTNNELKTIRKSIYGKNDAKEIPINETDVKENPAELEIKTNVEEEENKKDSYQVKYQRKYYKQPANSFGQLPQFQLQTQQLQLYLQQQPTTTLMAAAALLPLEYHHLADYRLLFNAERHIQFYLHTLTTATQNDFVTVATKQATETATLKSFQQPDAHNRYQDDDYHDDTDKTSSNDYEQYDDDDNDFHHHNEMKFRNLTNARALNILTDTIGAVFGVNTRPVAAIQGIQIEEIELYNGLSLRQSRFNPHNPCRILIHGWLGGSTAGIYNTLVPEYLHLDQGTYNVFTIDWGKGAMADYITASYRVKPVGLVVAKFIDFLHQESGIPFEQIHVIGFSMGAHVAGIAGKYVQNGRLPVIYGLDPALPLFRYENSNERLTANDADYVEVIHSSVGSYGYDRPLGHVDFYINFGYNQPGCFFNECSHFRAFQIFAQTLRKEKLKGKQCSSSVWWDMVKHKRCLKQTGRSLFVGVEGLRKSELNLRRGVYYVVTNAQAPYKIG